MLPSGQTFSAQTPPSWWLANLTFVGNKSLLVKINSNCFELLLYMCTVNAAAQTAAVNWATDKQTAFFVQLGTEGTYGMFFAAGLL